MSCTLEELQKTEYEILCAIADFCDENSINYSLYAGTLLGAIRHNGFIPWDDDVDIQMDAKSFRKFVKLVKKHPIPGFHLSWVDTEPEYSFVIAKVRKNGTFMIEEPFKRLDMNHGVYVDVFVYSSQPKNKKIAELKEKIYRLFVLLCRIYRYKDTDNEQNEEFAYSKKYQFLMNLSPKMSGFIRKHLFNLWSKLGSSKSAEVTFNNWTINPIASRPRDFCEPLAKHIYVDREFNVPQNYDKLLTRMYGDYMKPVQTERIHTELPNVHL